MKKKISFSYSNYELIKRTLFINYLSFWWSLSLSLRAFDDIILSIQPDQSNNNNNNNNNKNNNNNLYII